MRARLGGRVLAVAAMVGVFAGVGCTHHYYGYSEDQWHQLGTAEQDAARAEYQRAVDAKTEASQSDPVAEDRQRLIRRGLGMNPEHAPY